jgi:hypothetical protein
MSKQPKPIIHGRDHDCGGADPIPGICDLFPGAGGSADYETGVTSISSLVGYWRLGEGASPYADTSGYVPADPANAARQILTTAMTQNFTPGAPIVDDDGAAQFNAAGDSRTVSGDYLLTAYSTTTNRFNFASALPFTVACWIRPLASANTWQGTIIGTVKVTSFGSPSARDDGWRLDMNWPSRVVGFTRAPSVHAGDPYPTVQSPAGLDDATWHHVVGTYDGATLRLYLNGTLVASQADTSSISNGAVVTIGSGAGPQGSYTEFFYGAVDEAAVWSKALSAAEVAQLWLSGNTADTTGDAGKVLTSDGSGGVSYEYPTVDVAGTRYDRILAGTNITATDNSDGTVTLAATAAAADPAADTAVWMPLTTTTGGDDVLVFDADHSLIPTLIPL